MIITVRVRDATGAVATRQVSTTIGGSSISYGTYDIARGIDATEAAMRTAIGYNGVLNNHQRAYSGTNHPLTFATSKVANAANWHHTAMLNTKLTDWAGLANGAYDALINGFWSSWPVGIRGWVTCNHEPENDGGDPAVWVAGIRRYVALAAARIRARGLDVAVGGVLMSYSWDSERWRDYDWWTGLPAIDRPQTFFGLDHYGRCLPGPPVVGEDMITPLREIIDSVRPSGIQRFALFECGLDRRRKGQSTIIGSNQTIADWLPGFDAGLRSIAGMEAANMFFSGQVGPAAQYAQIGGVALPIWAQIVKNGLP